jgi:hypothetical protein
MAAQASRRLALSAILILIGVTDAAAEDSGSGRYQAIPLTKPNDMGNTVFIIDTKTGDVWKWFEGTSSSQVGGSGIRYEGAVVPGTPGEIVARQGFGLPLIQQRPAGK